MGGGGVVCSGIVIFALVTLILSTFVTVKPIFHCNAKPFALDRRVGLDPQRELFTLEILICSYLKANTKYHRPNANPQGPNANPHPHPWTQREQMEYSLHWVPLHWGSRWPCTFHVSCVNFFALGSQREPSFQWNMGFTCY